LTFWGGDSRRAHPPRRRPQRPRIAQRAPIQLDTALLISPRPPGTSAARPRPEARARTALGLAALLGRPARPADDAALARGRGMEKYEIGERLGDGAFGSVWRATRRGAPPPAPPLAVKRLHARFAGPGAWERALALREVRRCCFFCSRAGAPARRAAQPPQPPPRRPCRSPRCARCATPASSASSRSSARGSASTWCSSTQGPRCTRRSARRPGGAPRPPPPRAGSAARCAGSRRSTPRGSSTATSSRVRGGVV
jgi:hypothetical protein